MGQGGSGCGPERQTGQLRKHETQNRSQAHRRLGARRAERPGNELVLNKTCVDPFLTTNLGQALQNADANTIILMGLWTNYVVEATARHASDMGYRVFLVRECCASNTVENHEFTINKILPTICYVVSVKDTLAALE
jgi:nicotinamidase-related amidase